MSPKRRRFVKNSPLYLESVESVITKKWLLRKSDLKVVLTCLSPKIPSHDCGWNIPVSWAQGHSLAYHESIIHPSEPSVRPRGAKDKHWQHGAFCRTALRTPFQHPTNVYTCKLSEIVCRVGMERNVFQKTLAQQSCARKAGFLYLLKQQFSFSLKHKY